MERLNGMLDDISAEIGFTATSALVAWFGGTSLYVPGEVNPEHPLAKLLGISPYKRLVANWGSEVLNLPEGRQDEIDRRNKVIAQMLSEGLGSKAIGARTGLSERRVQQLRTMLERTGIIPLMDFPLKATIERRPVSETPPLVEGALGALECRNLLVWVDDAGPAHGGCTMLAAGVDPEFYGMAGTITHWALQCTNSD